MFCKNCGTEMKDNQKFCPKCGAKVIAETKVKANNKKIQALIICVCCFALVVSSVIGGVVWYKKNNNPQINESDKNYVYFDSNFSDIKITDADSALEAISTVKNELGISDVHKELKVQSVDTVDNNTYYRFQQYYNDIPVYGKNTVIHVNPNNYAEGLTSNCIKIEKLANEYGNKIKSTDDLVVFGNEFNVCNISYEKNDYETLMIFTDVLTNEIVGVLSQTYTDLDDFYFKQDDNSFLLYDEKRNIKMLNSNKKVLEKTFDYVGDGTTFDYCMKLYTDNNKDNKRDVENCNLFIKNTELNVEFNINNSIEFVTAKSKSDFDKTPITVIENVEKAYKFFMKKTHRKGFDNHNSRLYVSYNDKLSEDADGKNSYSFAGSLLSFGYNQDINSVDLIAHEYTHSVEHTISNMNYQSESGALMEAYSDIFGELIEGYSNGNDPDWIHNPQNTNRPLNKPSSNNYPEKYNDKNWKSTKVVNLFGENINDYGHVHNNSTVISHAAYLMWNGNGDGDIFKIDTDKLTILWYRSLFLLQSDATFNQCANAVMLTAKSMQDTGDLTDAQVACVRRSFESVGIYPNDYLTKSSTNGANVHVKDINGNNLSSYYLKVTYEKSNVIIDSEFSDSKPYVVNVTNSGSYTFIVKQSKKSSVEYVTKVRILNINRDSSELNLQTALDLGENKEVTEDSETNYGNVVSYNDCLYYWKYNSNSFSKEECAFANYGYNEKANNQLVCRTKDGKDNVILTTNGFYNIAIVNDVIYYQTADDPYHLSIKSCTINGDPLRNIGEGQLCGVIDNGKYIVYQENYDSGVHSIDTSTNALKNISDDKFLVCSNDSVICTKNNGAEKLSEQAISIYEINGDGSNKEELYLNKALELDSIKSISESDYYEHGYLDISLPYIKKDNLYFIFQHIAGSGHVTQSCRSVRINLDTGGSDELKITYYEDSGSLQKSSINDVDYQEYIENYYNKKVLNNSDYSDFSNLELGEYGAEGSGALIAEYCETVGNKRYILLTYGDFISWNGWRQTYKFQKCALYEKDLSSGKVIKIYDTTASNDNNDSIYQAYIAQLNKAFNKVKQDSKNDLTTMQFHPTYTVYDIDKNGVKELIVKTGICEADHTYEFYTYQNGIVLLGTAHAGHSGLYIPNDNNGLYLRYCPPPGDICYVSLYRLTINKNQIKQETLYKDKEMSFDERDKFSTQYKYLEEVHASDLSFLEDL